MAFSAQELDWLLYAPEAAQAVAEAQQLQFTKRTELADLQGLRKRYGDVSRAIAELVVARRHAEAKMPPQLARSWWADDTAVQQATPLVVAQWRAEYLRSVGADVVADVTCSVGTELWALRAAGVRAVGSDLDWARLRLARRNVPDVPVVRADALRPVWRADVVLADPARRNERGRIHRLADVVPNPAELLAAQHQDAAWGSRELAVKCAPGIDFGEVSEWAGHVDVVSMEGNVKEACVYTPGLLPAVGGSGTSEAGCRMGTGAGVGAASGVGTGDEASGGLLRRAVVIRRAQPVVDQPMAAQPTAPGSAGEGARAVGLDAASPTAAPAPQQLNCAAGGGLWEVMTVASGDREIPALDPVDAHPSDHGKYLVDPDGAIVRAGVVRHYAHRTGLRQLDPRIAYLTGDELPAGQRGFEVLEVVTLKQLRTRLRDYGATSVEILVRGVDVDPDQLRKSLKLRGGKGARKAAARATTTAVMEDAVGDAGSASGTAFTVVIARIGEHRVAYICRPGVVGTG